MAISDQISKEILAQLRYDILSYGWLSQMVRDVIAGRTKDEVDSILLDSIRQLLERQQVIVGHAVLVDDLLHVLPLASNTGDSIQILCELMRTADPVQSVEDADKFWVGPVPKKSRN